MLSTTTTTSEIDVIGFERTAPDPAVDQARDGVVSGNLVYNITSRAIRHTATMNLPMAFNVDGGTRILIEQNVIHDVDLESSWLVSTRTAPPAT